MRCHVVILDTTDTTYTFYEIEKRKDTKKKTRTKKTNRKKKRKKLKGRTVVPPPQGMWQTLDKNELEKEEEKNTTITGDHIK